MKLEKDLDPEITDMQDIMRTIKKKKNDLYDKTTIEFVDVSSILKVLLALFQFCGFTPSAWVLRCLCSMPGIYSGFRGRE